MSAMALNLFQRNEHGMGRSFALSALVHVVVVLRAENLKGWRQRRDVILVLWRIRWHRFIEAHRMLFSRRPLGHA